MKKILNYIVEYYLILLRILLLGDIKYYYEFSFC